MEADFPAPPQAFNKRSFSFRDAPTRLRMELNFKYHIYVLLIFLSGASYCLSRPLQLGASRWQTARAGAS